MTYIIAHKFATFALVNSHGSLVILDSDQLEHSDRRENDQVFEGLVIKFSTDSQSTVSHRAYYIRQSNGTWELLLHPQWYNYHQYFAETIDEKVLVLLQLGQTNVIGNLVTRQFTNPSLAFTLHWRHVDNNRGRTFPNNLNRKVVSDAN